MIKISSCKSGALKRVGGGGNPTAAVTVNGLLRANRNFSRGDGGQPLKCYVYVKYTVSAHFMRIWVVPQEFCLSHFWDRLFIF